MKILVFSLIGVMILLFIVCALVFPELVGIAGKKAKEIEASHRPDSERDPKSQKES